MRRALALAAGLASLLSAMPALAQRTAGTIIGHVTDESGAALPGVAVTLSSPAVPGNPATSTTSTGAYRFLALPPGRYEIGYSLQGFATLKRAEIIVSSGNTVDIPVTLKIGERTETISVSGDSPVVDVVSSQVNTTYDKELVQNIPIRRTFFDLFHSAPGTSTNNQVSDAVSSFGSGTSDNAWQLDGVDLGSSVNGTPWAYFNSDIMEEAQVLSLGAPARVASASGAVEPAPS